MSSDVVVIGTAVMDVIGYADRRPREGETLVGNGYQLAPGGKGLNQALAASRAGASSSLVAAVGRDEFGDALLRALRDDGVDSTAVFVRDEQPTGVGLPIVTRSGENSIVVVPGASVSIGPDHHEWIRESVSERTVFLSQAELPLSVTSSALAHASALGARVVLNPAPAGDLGDVLDDVDVLVPNQPEAEDLTGRQSPEAAAKEMSQWKEGLGVVITCGPAGALVLETGETTWIEAPDVDAVDTVGAGDVFCGYLAAQMSRGEPLLNATRIAVNAASISVMRRGAAKSAPHVWELD